MLPRKREWVIWFAGTAKTHHQYVAVYKEIAFTLERFLKQWKGFRKKYRTQATLKATGELFILFILHVFIQKCLISSCNLLECQPKL